MRKTGVRSAWCFSQRFEYAVFQLVRVEAGFGGGMNCDSWRLACDRAARCSEMPTVPQRVCSASVGACEEAAGALVRAVLSRRDDYTLRKHAAFKGFEILRHQPAAPVPELFVRGRRAGTAHQRRQSRRHPAKHSSTRWRPPSRCGGRTTAAARARKPSTTIRPRPSGPSSTRRG